MAKKSALARLQTRVRNSRERERTAIQSAIGKGSGLVVAAGVGAFEAKVPATIAKIPTKLIGAGILYLIAAYTKGTASKIADSAADSLKDIYAYKVAMQARMGQASPFIAGTDEDDETGYVIES